MLFGSRIINCSQEETFGNFLSRLEDKFSDYSRDHQRENSSTVVKTTELGMTGKHIDH